MQIFYLPKFAREYKKLPSNIQDLAEKREKIFSKDPFDPRLKTHRLHGPLHGFWSFSIDYKNRIIFDFVDHNTVRFYSIGDHDIYD